MKIIPKTKRDAAFTLIDILVVLVFIGFLAAAMLTVLLKQRGHDWRIRCINNCKQIGLSFRVWENDHNGNFPMDVSKGNGGSMEFITGANAFRHFQVMSNELSTPSILLCPAESDRAREVAKNFTAFKNSNLSYFIGVNAATNDPNSLISGDHNLTNGTPIQNGLLDLASRPAGWTSQMHNKCGNLVFADGSVAQVSSSGFRVARGGSSAFTNRLQMPVLGP